jgi:hypothetical protein
MFDREQPFPTLRETMKAARAKQSKWQRVFPTLVLLFLVAVMVMNAEYRALHQKPHLHLPDQASH